MARNQVFISYSHNDRAWLARLRVHLKPLERKAEVKVWADTQIDPGKKWKDEIQQALTSAKVAVLLVSPDFLASEFIHQNELPPLLAAAEQEGLTILWVLVSACSYQWTTIAKYQAAYPTDKPLDQLRAAQRQSALVEIVARIERAWSSALPLPVTPALPPEAIARAAEARHEDSQSRGQADDQQAWPSAPPVAITPAFQHEGVTSPLPAAPSPAPAPTEERDCMARDQVFISYSHADSDWLKRLQIVLTPLRRRGLLKIWADTDITPGHLWKEDIQQALARANVAVLLVSPDFLASDFIDKHELPPLLEEARQGGLTILWVPLRHSLYKVTDIAQYQAVYDPRTPLSTLTPAQQDAALVQIAEALMVINPLVKQQKSVPPASPELSDIQVLFDEENVGMHGHHTLYFSFFHNAIIFGKSLAGDHIEINGIIDSTTASYISNRYYESFKYIIHPSQFAYKNNALFYLDGWNGSRLRLFKIKGQIKKENIIAVSFLDILLFNSEDNSFKVRKIFNKAEIEQLRWPQESSEDIKYENELISQAEVEGSIRALALSPDMKYMAAGIDGRSIIYSCATGKKIKTIDESSPSRSFQGFYMAFSRDSRYYAFITPKENASSRGITSVVLIDTLTWKEINRFSNELGGIHTFTLSQDGKYIATGDDKPEVVIWDIEKGQRICTLKSPHRTYTWPYSAIAISLTNNYIMASRFNFIDFWHLKSGEYMFRVDMKSNGYFARFPSEKFYFSSGAESYVYVVSELNKYPLLEYRKLNPGKLDHLIVSQQEMVQFLSK